MRETSYNTRPCTISNEALYNARTAQARASEHIAQFMWAFCDGQFGSLTRHERIAFERLVKKNIELFKGINVESFEVAENRLDDFSYHKNHINILRRLNK